MKCKQNTTNGKKQAALLCFQATTTRCRRGGRKRTAGDLQK